VTWGHPRASGWGVAELPIVSLEFALQIEAVGVGFMLRWLDAVRARPDNPVGVELHPLGGAVATLAVHVPDVAFMNTIYGLAPADVGIVDEAVALYDAAGITPSVELFPHPSLGPIASRLASHGIVPCDTYAALYGPAHDIPTAAPDSGVEVRPVQRGEAGLFARVISAGHNLDGDALDAASANTLPWAAIPGWSLYLAWLDGAPAGAAALMASGEIGYLANAAVLPDFRRRGVHSALVRRRTSDAAGTGCRLVCAMTSFGSVSQGTMERAGLRIAYLKQRWSRPR